MNQDRIRDRILRRASRMWGYNESETENTSLRQRGEIIREIRKFGN